MQPENHNLVRIKFDHTLIGRDDVVVLTAEGNSTELITPFTGIDGDLCYRFKTSILEDKEDDEYWYRKNGLLGLVETNLSHPGHLRMYQDLSPKEIPFDMNLAGLPNILVKDKCGAEVNFIGSNAEKEDYPYIFEVDGVEYHFTYEGKFYEETPSEDDLIMYQSPVPLPRYEEEVVGDRVVGVDFKEEADSLIDAVKNSDGSKITCNLKLKKEERPVIGFDHNSGVLEGNVFKMISDKETVYGLLYKDKNGRILVLQNDRWIHHYYPSYDAICDWNWREMEG